MQPASPADSPLLPSFATPIKLRVFTLALFQTTLCTTWSSPRAPNLLGLALGYFHQCFVSWSLSYVHLSTAQLSAQCWKASAAKPQLKHFRLSTSNIGSQGWETDICQACNHFLSPFSFSKKLQHNKSHQLCALWSRGWWKVCSCNFLWEIFGISWDWLASPCHSL